MSAILAALVTLVGVIVCGWAGFENEADTRKRCSVSGDRFEIATLSKCIEILNRNEDSCVANLIREATLPSPRTRSRDDYEGGFGPAR